MVGTWGVGVFKEDKQVCGVSIRLHYLSTNLHSFSKDRSDFIMGSCISFLIALVYFLGRLSFGVACAGPASCCAVYSSHFVFYVCLYIVVAPSQFPIPIFANRKRQSKG